nr:MAG TPA: hypothetical protein [Caudoviricetes sp.]
MFNLVNPWYYCICKDLRIGLWKSLFCLFSIFFGLVCLGLNAIANSALTTIITGYIRVY